MVSTVKHIEPAFCHIGLKATLTLLETTMFRLMKNRYEDGFTLIELVIALTIIGILAGIALPAYQESVVKSRRSDAKAVMVELANRLERFYVDNGQYTDNMTTLGGTTTTQGGWYTVSITGTTVNSRMTGYTITATPTGAQASNDTKCAKLTLTNTGVKGILDGDGTGSVATCW